MVSRKGLFNKQSLINFNNMPLSEAAELAYYETAIKRLSRLECMKDYKGNKLIIAIATPIYNVNNAITNMLVIDVNGIYRRYGLKRETNTLMAEMTKLDVLRYDETVISLKDSEKVIAIIDALIADRAIKPLLTQASKLTVTPEEFHGAIELAVKRLRKAISKRKKIRPILVATSSPEAK